jgi:hypothetical protein
MKGYSALRGRCYTRTDPDRGSAPLAAQFRSGYSTNALRFKREAKGAA